MYYFGGVTQRELARQYGCAQTTMHKRLKKILGKMRRAAE